MPISNSLPVFPAHWMKGEHPRLFGEVGMNKKKVGMEVQSDVKPAIVLDIISNTHRMVNQNYSSRSWMMTSSGVVGTW